MNIWDKLYDAMSKLENNEPQVYGIIIHPFVYKRILLFDKYQKAGYPLGKNRKGFKKWSKKKEGNIQNSPPR
jgi:hypothetical protein